MSIAAENAEIMQLLDGKAFKENIVHLGMLAPQFLVGGGSSTYTNSQGVPWTAAYINGDAQGELTSDRRSDIQKNKITISLTGETHQIRQQK